MAEEEDGTTDVVQIQEGIQFHDGDEVTASDVARSFTAPVEEETQNAATYAMIESVEPIDDYPLEAFVERSICTRERPAYEVEPAYGSGTRYAACHRHR